MKEAAITTLKMSPIEIPLKSEKDVVRAREEAAVLADKHGYSDLALAQIALAVSEIGHNALVHAGQGTAKIEALREGKVIRITVSDEGIGIPNIAHAMEQGFSTSRASLGIGLDVAQRSMDKMTIESKTQKGTKVVLEKYYPIIPEQIEIGVVSVPDDRYDYNGDTYIYKAFGGHLLLIGVVDGVGQGFRAKVFAETIKNFVLENFELPLDEIIRRCDETIREEKLAMGAAIGLALINLDNKTVEFCGVGDTHAYVQNKNFRSFTFQGGQLCTHLLPTLKVQKIILPQQGAIVLCTDGIKTSIDPNELDWKRSSQWLANNIFNQFHRPYGDATVLVAKSHLEDV